MTYQTKSSIETLTTDGEADARMAPAIAVMGQNDRGRPDLATISRQVHLSQPHFQQLLPAGPVLALSNFCNT
jgi:AraC-like DNA-binding protein